MRKAVFIVAFATCSLAVSSQTGDVDRSLGAQSKEDVIQMPHTPEDRVLLDTAAPSQPPRGIKNRAVALQRIVHAPHAAQMSLKTSLRASTVMLSAKKNSNWFLYMALLLLLIGSAILIVALDVLPAKTVAVIYGLLLMVLVFLYLRGYV
jgi:hypothetical protein